MTSNLRNFANFAGFSRILRKFADFAGFRAFCENLRILWYFWPHLFQLEMEKLKGHYSEVIKSFFQGFQKEP